MSLTVDIFRSDYRSRLNVFEAVRRLTIVNLEGPSTPAPDAPAAMLVPGNLPGILKVVPAGLNDRGEYVEAKPIDLCGPMFGGTFAYSSDTRWAKPTRHCGAIPIHDRFETAAAQRED